MELINNKKYYIYHETDDKFLKYIKRFNTLSIEDIKDKMDLYELLPIKLLKFLNTHHIIKIIDKFGKYKCGGKLLENNYPETIILYVTGLKCAIEYEVDDNNFFIHNTSEKKNEEAEMKKIWKLYKEDKIIFMEKPDYTKLTENNQLIVNVITLDELNAFDDSN